jgi:hypothetical protein
MISTFEEVYAAQYDMSMSFFGFPAARKALEKRQKYWEFWGFLGESAASPEGDHRGKISQCSNARFAKHDMSSAFEDMRCGWRLIPPA